MSSMKADYRVGVGASSVLMILVALAMAALGLLAFGSARMTETLTRRNVDVSAAYYEAAAKVQEKLCEIDGAALAYRRLDGRRGRWTRRGLRRAARRAWNGRPWTASFILCMRRMRAKTAC